MELYCEVTTGYNPIPAAACRPADATAPANAASGRRRGVCPRLVDRRAAGDLVDVLVDAEEPQQRLVLAHHLGLYPLVTSQYSSTTLYHVSDHIPQLFFLK